MKRFKIIVLLLCLSVLTAAAQQNITIKGTAANGHGKRIELYRYSDPLSNRLVLLDSCRIDDKKGFTLRSYANYPLLLTLQVDDYDMSFYAEPGREYDVVIPDFDWNIDEKRNIHLDREPLPVVFSGISDADINLQIDEFHTVVDSFIVQNRTFFDYKFHPQKRYFDTLVATVNELGPTDNTDDFIGRYKHYYLARLKYDLRFDSRVRTFKKEIDGQPIRYYDEAYMSLFCDLFADYISHGNKYVTLRQLVRWVDNYDVDIYLDSLGVDPLLHNEQIRELALLVALNESYYDFRNYDRQAVGKTLMRLAQKTKFPEHRTLAESLLRIYAADERGQEVPSFVLPDVDMRKVDLNSFRGEWIYLSFVRCDDPTSIGELETISHFIDSVYKKSDSIEFITIECSRDRGKMDQFLESRRGKRYDWIWLHFDGNYELLRYFDVYSYPWFVLIDPQGRIHYNITPAPSTGFLITPPWQRAKTEPKKVFFLDQYRQ
ncbi:MAG: redoxin family protein [Bacteroidales bacterium]|nr:redoxin family protein [Bacteroidales bacterium]